MQGKHLEQAAGDSKGKTTRSEQADSSTELSVMQNYTLGIFPLVRWRKLLKLPNYMRQQGSKMWLKG